MILAAVAGGAGAAAPALAALSVGAVLAILVWHRSALFLHGAVFVVLAIRPALDMYTERRLGLGPFAMSPAVLFGLGVLWITLVVGIRRARDGAPLWPDPALRGIHFWLLLTYVIGLSAGWRLYGSQGLETGVREAARMASVLGAFLLVLWWVDGRIDRYRQAWLYLVLGAVVPVATALWQWIMVSGNLEIAGINRLEGTFGHPHTFGPYLVPFILACVANASLPGVGRRIALLAVAAGLTVLLARTYSRTAELVLVMGLTSLLFLQAGRLDRRAVIRGALAVVVFVAVGWIIAGDAVRERFSGIRIGSEAIEAARTGQTENSFEWRLLNWGGLIALGAEHPYTGHGTGMITELNPLRDPATDLPYTAHDDFVRVFFETGVLGLIPYLLYGLFLSLWALRVARGVQSRWAPGAFGAVASFVALFFLTGGTPEFGTQTAVQYEVYAMLGLLTALPQRERTVQASSEVGLSQGAPTAGE